ETAFGHAHPEVANARHGLGTILLEERKLDAALEQYNAALAIERTALGEEDPSVAGMMTTVAHVELELGHVDAALEGFQRAQQIWVRTLPPDDPAHAFADAGLGRAWVAKG